MREIVECVAQAIREEMVGMDAQKDADDIRDLARAAIRTCLGGTIVTALRQAEDALDVLRRGHGVEVSDLCYPALNTVRDAMREIAGALE